MGWPMDCAVGGGAGGRLKCGSAQRQEVHLSGQQSFLDRDGSYSEDKAIGNIFSWSMTDAHTAQHRDETKAHFSDVV